MSTTFAVVLKNGEQYEIARRVGGGILRCEFLFINEVMAELIPDETPVTPTDNTAQGIFTIGDIREHIRKQEEAEKGGLEEDLEDQSWIDDLSKIEYYQRKSIFAPMTDAFHKEYDFIEVTEWKNGEGWDIDIAASEGNKHVSLHFTEFEVMKELIALLEKN